MYVEQSSGQDLCNSSSWLLLVFVHHLLCTLLVSKGYSGTSSLQAFILRPP